MLRLVLLLLLLLLLHAPTPTPTPLLLLLVIVGWRAIRQRQDSSRRLPSLTGGLGRAPREGGSCASRTRELCCFPKTQSWNTSVFQRRLELALRPYRFRKVANRKVELLISRGLYAKTFSTDVVTFHWKGPIAL